LKISTREIKMENKCLNKDTRSRIRAIEAIYATSAEEYQQTIHDISHFNILEGVPVRHLEVQKKNLLSSVDELSGLMEEYLLLTEQRAAPPAYEACKSCIGTVGRLLDGAIAKKEAENLESINAGNFEYLKGDVFGKELMDVLFHLN
jgi:hypothetical protein